VIFSMLVKSVGWGECADPNVNALHCWGSLRHPNLRRMPIAVRNNMVFNGFFHNLTAVRKSVGWGECADPNVYVRHRWGSWRHPNLQRLSGTVKL